ncbi:MAG TPA: ATP-binding protein [Gemmataceae bacterium]|nr:ATP-binding protein [Gemmataceae bacterium]
MSVDPAPYSLTLPSDLRLLSLARLFVESICMHLNFDLDFTEAVQAATHEALQNIMRHAHDGRPDALWQLEILPVENGLEIRLHDDGEHFDVSGVPHLQPGEMRIGGRGVFLMRRIMDQVVSERKMPKGNVLRMVKLDRASRRSYA